MFTGLRRALIACFCLSWITSSVGAAERIAEKVPKGNDLLPRHMDAGHELSGRFRDCPAGKDGRFSQPIVVGRP
jgi:hypothetical protein